MSLATRPLRAPAALLGAGLLLAACGGGNEDLIRQQSELRSKLELQAGEAEALRARVRDLEARSRSLEEQVAGLGVRPAPGTAAPSAAAPGAGGASPGDATAPAPAAGDVAALLETEAGREKLREFLKEEEARKEEVARRESEERMDAFIKDRVTGFLTEQLNLTADQQARVIDIASEAGRRYAELWRGNRPGGPGAAAPADMQALREKSEEIRKETMDKLSQALTVDQYNKLEELGPGAGMIMGGRGFGGGGPAAPRSAPGMPGGRGGR